MDRVAKSIGVIHYNDDAMKKVCLIVRLGFDATAEMYAAELKNTLRKDEHPADVAQQIERGIDEQLKEKRPLYAQLFDSMICFSRNGKDRYYKASRRRAELVKAKSYLIIGSGGLRISK